MDIKTADTFCVGCFYMRVLTKISLIIFIIGKGNGCFENTSKSKISLIILNFLIK